MPEPMRMRSVRGRDRAVEDLRVRAVRVLVEEVVLDDPDVLEAGPGGGLDERDLLHDHLVLVVRVPLALVREDRMLDEDAELHGTPLENEWRHHNGKHLTARQGGRAGRVA